MHFSYRYIQSSMKCYTICTALFASIMGKTLRNGKEWTTLYLSTYILLFILNKLKPADCKFIMHVENIDHAQFECLVSSIYRHIFIIYDSGSTVNTLQFPSGHRKWDTYLSVQTKTILDRILSHMSHFFEYWQSLILIS